ncbi:MAG: CDP-alcohol phosphatidyltransferase family protein [Anaerolineaceae bacterium]|jgi:CDP-diacylglycerol--glycerol-3-phosphate 3-phosphatidyltransferase|nr:CDP-alcohol phosphatidyltransferase family protein [Chloroflexota bacterium]
MSETKTGKSDFESFLRRTFQKPLDWLAGRFLRLGLTPNHITLLGLLGNIGAATLIIYGYLQWGGLLAALMAPLDAVDGAMARLQGNTSRFGAFFDSVTDRYDELILLGALIIYFFNQSDRLGVVLTFLAAMGSVLVSYTRARAEGLDLKAKVGVLTRIERSFILIIGLLIGRPIFSVGIIAVLANITAVQRIAWVWKQTNAE